MKKLTYIFGIGVVAGLLFLLWGNLNTQSYYSETQINSNLTVKSNESIIIHNGSKFTVNGDLNLNGKIKCSKGPLQIYVTGNLNVSGELECDREYKTEEFTNSAIKIVANNKIIFTKNAKVNTNSSIEITNSESQIALDNDQLKDYFNEIRVISSKEQIGPLQANTDKENLNANISKNFLDLISTKVSAQDEVNTPQVKLSGEWNLDTSEESLNHISLIYINVNTAGLTEISDWKVKGPNGQPGENDSKDSCSATGTNGTPGYGILIKGGQFAISNSTITLSNGGKGGDATTLEQCEEAFAQGGKGGLPANFKIEGSKIKVEENFKIEQGENGPGGNAKATVKDKENSCNAETGGNATAIAGSASNYEGYLYISDNITGNENINIQNAKLNQDGTAYAQAGDGSSGTECGCPGGNGGNAEASGQEISAIPGEGGDAGICKSEDTDKPANGGNGGNATTDNKSKIIEADGGNGGTGSTSCPAGLGGLGGTGFTEGQNGEAGKDICQSTTQSFNLSSNELIKKHSQSINECPNIFSNTILLNTTEWKILESPEWIDFKQINDQEVEARFNCSIKKPGTYNGTITIESEDSKTEGQTENINVNIEITE
jgi:hypothetical protein